MGPLKFSLLLVTLILISIQGTSSTSSSTSLGKWYDNCNNNMTYPGIRIKVKVVRTTPTTHPACEKVSLGHRWATVVGGGLKIKTGFAGCGVTVKTVRESVTDNGTIVTANFQSKYPWSNNSMIRTLNQTLSAFRKCVTSIEIYCLGKESQGVSNLNQQLELENPISEGGDNLSVLVDGSCVKNLYAYVELRDMCYMLTKKTHVPTLTSWYGDSNYINTYNKMEYCT